MEILNAEALRVELLQDLVLVACDGEDRYSYLATVKLRPDGVKYRVLVMNDSIRIEAQNLLEIARHQADAAAAVDAQLFAAGQEMRLQWLSVGQSDFGRDG